MMLDLCSLFQFYLPSGLAERLESEQNEEVQKEMLKQIVRNLPVQTRTISGCKLTFLCFAKLKFFSLWTSRNLLLKFVLFVNFDVRKFWQDGNNIMQPVCMCACTQVGLSIWVCSYTFGYDDIKWWNVFYL